MKDNLDVAEHLRGCLASMGPFFGHSLEMFLNEIKWKFKFRVFMVEA